MPAAFGRVLILDLDGACGGLLEHPHRMGDIDRVAEAGTRIDNQRQIDDAANRQNVLRDLAQVHESKIGQAEVHVGEAHAGEINLLEAEIGDHLRGERIGAPAIARHGPEQAWRARFRCQPAPSNVSSTRPLAP